MRSLFVFATVVVVLLAQSAAAAEIDYIEDFVLAKDRAKALEKLIPGSEDHYYYTCLHLQNLEQYDRVEQVLADWIKRYKYTPRVTEIQNRQALLTYPNNPAKSLEYLQKRLNLQFNHQRVRLGEKPNLPTQFDSALISRDRLFGEATRRYRNLDGFEDSALIWLAERGLDPDRRRALLQRLDHPDFPNLVAMVAADLNHRGSKPFGSMKVHGNLMLAQLEELQRRRPDLRNQAAFVNAYLSKLRPDNDSDWLEDPELHAAYLDRVWEYVSTLAPVHNSLKVNVLYQRLHLDRSEGRYNRQKFMEYIRLPRRVGYIEQKYLALAQNRRYAADLNADFRQVTGFSAIRDDEPLVRSYLHHFFREDANTRAYEAFIDDTYLRHNFAEAKIVNGLGEPEDWYSLLPPDKYQALKDRIDLDFAFTNPRSFEVDQVVGLDLHVKNVENLIVKVFEINTRNYFRQHQRDVNTDINLDGLVPNQELTFTYNEPPLRRVRRHFEFAHLNRPGVYVVDFIGNGMNSRVLVRKGHLRHLVRTTPLGQEFTILDGKNQLVSDATIWLSGQEYQADQDGKILVPFSTRPGRQAIVISRGEQSVLSHFQHEAEKYSFSAGFYVDRESLLANRKAQLLIRSSLAVNGIPISVGDMKQVELVLTSTDLDGVTTTRTVPEFALSEDRESLFDFSVPQRLAKLDVQLRGTIRSLSRNKEVTLSADDQFQINGIETTEKTSALYLGRGADQYFLDLLGKSGERHPDQAVAVLVKHRDFKNPVTVSLQTDRNGRIGLGQLEDVNMVTATGPDGQQRNWNLSDDLHSGNQSIHQVAGEPIEVPYMGQADAVTREEFSLIEVRGSTYVSDQFARLSLEEGMLRLNDLAPGDYLLLLRRSNEALRVRIVEGEKSEGFGLGRTRHLELPARSTLQIASTQVEDEELRVRLVHADKFTRVHLFATRYVPPFSAFVRLDRVANPQPLRIRLSHPKSLYMAGRNIGDEYQYIINRQYAQKYPGVMLERPSVLLNPWPVRGTDTSQQRAGAGGEFAPADAARPDAEARSRSGSRAQRAEADYPNLDFLAEPTATLLNLQPDENGLVVIPLEEIGPHQHLHVVAVDPLTTVYRSVAMPDQDVAIRDLRLARGLEAEQHFTQQKQIDVVAADGSFVISDLRTSRFEVYDSLRSVYSLFSTLNNDAKLIKFAFILDWPELEDERKRELYAEFACHELNFFLFRKDPKFFQGAVRPYLANKRDKTFLDRWLLDHDLTSYLQPWNYQRLNTVERILLSQRVAADRQHSVVDLQNRLDLLPFDQDRATLLFLTALKGTALDANSPFGMVVEEQLAEFESAGEALGMGGFGGGGARAGRGRSVDNFAAPGVPAPPGAAAAPEAAPESEAPKSKVERRARFNELKRVEDRQVENLFGSRAAKQPARQLYVALDKTREWVENNYYQLPIEVQNGDLIPINAFWRDYSLHDGETPFLSDQLAYATGNFTEMMFALAVLDLPFAAAEHDVAAEEAELKLTAGSPLVVFHEQILQVNDRDEQTPILATQNYFRHGDRYRYVGSERRDKFVTDEFLMRTVYGCQVVVTNPTSTPQKLDLLLQIPVGAVPVLKTHQTRSVHLDLQPYNTRTIEYHFYFPATGEFPHYPVQVTKNERLLAAADPVDLTVVEELSRIDRESWAYLSQNGSDDDVLRFLESQNLHRISLDTIAFRMKQKPFFLKVVELLGQRHVYDHTLWSYSLFHDEPATIREYLQHTDSFVAQCGMQLDSSLLRIDPVSRRIYQHIDYKPLVNARAHSLGRRRQILNDRMSQQYHRLLKVLSYRRGFHADELLAITYYLLLQDRVSEALDYFGQINAEELQTRIQYDYFAAYLALYQEDTEKARQVAGQYQQYPVDRWRLAFAAVERQLDEIEGAPIEVLDPENRNQTQTKLADSTASFDFKIEGSQVQVNYQHLPEVRVNYYLMDIELLFSRNPFVQQYSNQFSSIRPNLSETHQLPADQRQFEFTLPEELQNRNVLVELSGGGEDKSQVFYSNSLVVQTMENYGQLRVTNTDTGRPLSTTYVKVYARFKDGSVRFYKDGYTDLRGRFDYSSLNTSELDQVDRFSLLVISDAFGAVVREAAPPKQ